jgi:serine/threonine-protein phosphatase 2A regulatory subunit B
LFQNDVIYYQLKNERYIFIDKTIKLWKIGPRKKFISNCVTNLAENKRLSLPTVDHNVDGAELLHAQTKGVYANAHAYHINSLALNSDLETFISADDLRINCWRLGHSDTCFSKCI